MSVPVQIGNYRLEREIGRGATSEVWLGRHVQLQDHVVAVKVLMSQDREAVRRFQREAAIAARLRHPNVPQLFDHGYVQPFHYTAMEYVEGAALRQILERRGKLPLADALAIFRQVAAGLDYAHGLGVVHRDVSPGNVLVEQKTGRALITDFGIARDGGAPITVVRQIMGTPGYLSPEHAQSSASVTHLSDIFGLGVVLYEMLAGALPWEDPPGLPDGPPFAPTIPLKDRGVTGLPSDVERVIRTLLAVDPASRFPSGQAAVAELDRIFQRHEVATQILPNLPPDGPAEGVQFQAGGLEPSPVETVLGPDLLRAPIDRAHRRADELRRPAAVAALLDAWAAEDRLRRRPLLGRLARLHKVASRNVYFYRLRVLYERRDEPETQEEPDRKAQVFPVEALVERWDVPLPGAKSFDDDPGGSVPIPGSTRVVTCQGCSGRGTVLCSNCGGKQRVYVTRTVPAAATQRAAAAPGAAAPAAAAGAAAAPTAAPPAAERTEQVLVPCPECSGRGGIDCPRCTGVGRLVRRQSFRWSRQAQAFQAQDDLPALDEGWLARACKAEVIYAQRQIGGLRPEWAMLPTLEGAVQQIQARLDDTTRVVLGELTISFIPVTDLVFDLGKPGEEGLYKLAVYGFENLIPPDWRFFNWERVVYLCAIVFLAVLVAALIGFILLA
jgi:serine/threonine protein kinase